MHLSDSDADDPDGEGFVLVRTICTHALRKNARTSTPTRGVTRDAMLVYVVAGSSCTQQPSTLCGFLDRPGEADTQN